MDKQTTLAFVFIGIILVVWLYMNAPEPQPQQPSQTDTTLVESRDTVEIKREAVQPETKTPTPILNVPDTLTVKVEERIITVETDLVRMEFSTRGGAIRRYFLKNYNTWYFRKLSDTASFYQKQVQLINSQLGNDFHLIFVTQEGQLVNTKDSQFTTESDGYHYKVETGDSLKISFASQFGEGQVVKHFTIFSDKYASDVDIEFINMHNVLSGLEYDVIWENGINFTEENSFDEANYSNASAYAGDEEVVVDASSPGEVVQKELNGLIDWVGVRTKYFGMLIAPDTPYSDGGSYFEGEQIQHPQYGTREYYSARLRIPFEKVNYQKDSFKLFIGPIDYHLLKSYDENFEAFFNFGSFFGLKFITRPISEFILLPLFTFLHNFIPNYGFVIIVFSLIIKFALYPLTRQSYKSMRRMQLLQPKIQKLKEQYKDDQQRVQKETMKLYSTYGINPAGGCLPMLLQMPILFALFTFFNVAIEIRNEPFILWITNLSSPDVILKLPFKIPLFGIDQITGLAPLLGITMFFQQKMSVKDPSQKALVYIMPVMFTLMFMGFSSGLNLYYFMFNLFSIMQQYYINNKSGEEDLVPVKNPKKKGGFMQRMMDAAEQQAQAQKQGGKKKKRK
jgi:YidC/Oxa1 family membrane protein insertase